MVLLRNVLRVMLCQAALGGLGLALASEAGRAETVAPASTDAAPAPASVADLGLALQLDQLFVVLRDEGLAYGVSLQGDMLDETGGQFWTKAVSAIYDTGAMRARFDAALQEELAEDAAVLAEAVAFLGSDLGQRVVGLEIEARRAFLDTALEEAARVAADDRAGARDPLVKQIRRFVVAADLLESNVAASLSANLAFMTGMSDSGLYGEGLPQDQLLADVWADEASLRDSSALWLDAFLGLAYAPLTEAELEAYISFMESPAGKRLNAALFSAYGSVYRQISYDLGRAVGVTMLSRSI